MTNNSDTPGARREETRAIFERSLQLLVDKDMKGWVELFDEQAVFEFPFAPETYPTRLEGRAAIYDYIKDFPNNIDLTGFRNIRFHYTLDPDVLIVEMSSEGRAIATGKPYNVSYINVLEFRGDKIALYRDYWSPSVVGDSLGGMDAMRDAFGGGDLD